MTEEKATFNEPPHSNMTLQSKAMDLESGILGRFFGSPARAPLNIAGTVLFAIAAAGIVLLFLPGNIPAVEFWKLVLPAFTLILGFVFGQKSS